MTTNRQAEGMTRINFQVSEEEKAQIQALAKASRMTVSEYVRTVLDDALAAEVVFGRTRQSAPRELMAAEDPGEYHTGKGRRKDRPADDEQVG